MDNQAEIGIPKDVEPGELLKQGRYSDWVDRKCFGEEELDVGRMMSRIKKSRKKLAPNYWRAVEEMEAQGIEGVERKTRLERVKSEHAQEYGEMRLFEAEAVGRVKERLIKEAGAFFKGWLDAWALVEEVSNELNSELGNSEPRNWESWLTKYEFEVRRDIKEVMYSHGLKRGLLPERAVEAFWQATRSATKIRYFFSTQIARMDEQGKLDEVATGKRLFQLFADSIGNSHYQEPKGRVSGRLGRPPVFVKLECENERDLHELTRGEIALFSQELILPSLSLPEQAVAVPTTLLPPSGDQWHRVKFHEIQHSMNRVVDRHTNKAKLVFPDETRLAREFGDLEFGNYLILRVKNEILACLRSHDTYQEIYDYAVGDEMLNRFIYYADRHFKKSNIDLNQEKQILESVMLDYLVVLQRLEKGLRREGSNRNKQLEEVKSKSELRLQVAAYAMYADYDTLVGLANLVDPERITRRKERTETLRKQRVTKEKGGSKRALWGLIPRRRRGE